MGAAGSDEYVWSSIRGPPGSLVGATAASVIIASIGWGRSFLLAAGLLALAAPAMFAVRPVDRTSA